MSVRIKQKVDTQANWQKSKLILLKGEVAVEVRPNGDPFRFKIGDGEKMYSQLPYASDGLTNGVDIMKATKDSQTVVRTLDDDGRVFFVADAGDGITPQELLDVTEDSDSITIKINEDTGMVIFEANSDPDDNYVPIINNHSEIHNRDNEIELFTQQTIDNVPIFSGTYIGEDSVKLTHIEGDKSGVFEVRADSLTFNGENVALGGNFPVWETWTELGDIDETTLVPAIGLQTDALNKAVEKGALVINVAQARMATITKVVTGVAFLRTVADFHAGDADNSWKELIEKVTGSNYPIVRNIEKTTVFDGWVLTEAVANGVFTHIEANLTLSVTSAEENSMFFVKAVDVNTGDVIGAGFEMLIEGPAQEVIYTMAFDCSPDTVAHDVYLVADVSDGLYISHCWGPAYFTTTNVEYYTNIKGTQRPHHGDEEMAYLSDLEVFTYFDEQEMAAIERIDNKLFELEEEVDDLAEEIPELQNNVATLMQEMPNKGDKFWGGDLSDFVELRNTTIGHGFPTHTILDFNSNIDFDISDNEYGQITFDTNSGVIGSEIAIMFGNGTWIDEEFQGKFIILVKLPSLQVLEVFMNNGEWINKTYQLDYTSALTSINLSAGLEMPDLINYMRFSTSKYYNMIDLYNSEKGVLDNIEVDLIGVEGDVANAISIANEAEDKADTAIATANDAEDKADTAIATANDADAKADEAIETANEALEEADYVKENVGEVGVDTVIEGADVVVDLVDFHDLNDQLISRAYADEHFTDPQPPKINNSALIFGGNKSGAQLGLVDQQVSAGSSTTSVLNYGDEVILGYTDATKTNVIEVDTGGIEISAGSHTLSISSAGVKADDSLTNVNNYPTVTNQINPSSINVALAKVGDSVSFHIASDQVTEGGHGPKSTSIITAIKASATLINFSAIDPDGLSWYGSSAQNATAIVNWAYGEIVPTFNEVLDASQNDHNNNLLIQDDGLDGAYNDTQYTNSGVYISEISSSGQSNNTQVFADGYLNMYNPNNGNYLLVDTYRGQFDAGGQLGDALYNWIQTYVPSPTPPPLPPIPDDYIFYGWDAFTDFDTSVVDLELGHDFYFDTRSGMIGGLATSLTVKGTANWVVGQYYRIATMRPDIHDFNHWLGWQHYNFSEPYDHAHDPNPASHRNKLTVDFILNEAGDFFMVPTKVSGLFTTLTQPYTVPYAPYFGFLPAGMLGIYTGDEMFDGTMDVAHIQLLDLDFILDDNARTFGNDVTIKLDTSKVNIGQTYALTALYSGIKTPAVDQSWTVIKQNPEGVEIFASVTFFLKTDRKLYARVNSWDSSATGNVYQFDASLPIKRIDRA
jgi:hypothetical protein